MSELPPEKVGASRRIRELLRIQVVADLLEWCISQPVCPHEESLFGALHAVAERTARQDPDGASDTIMATIAAAYLAGRESYVHGGSSLHAESDDNTEEAEVVH